MTKLTVSDKLREEWAFSYSSFVLNSKEIPNIDIRSWEVLWGEPVARGVFSFVDHSDANESQSLSLLGGLLQVFTVSQDDGTGGFEHEHTYEIIKVDTSRDPSNGDLTITCSVHDASIMLLKKTFLNTVGENETPIEFMRKHLNGTGFNPNFALKEDLPKQNIVAPTHINGWEFLKKYTESLNTKIISDRGGTDIVSDGVIKFHNASVSGEPKFEYNTQNPGSFWNIIEYYPDGLDEQRVENSGPTKTSRINDDSLNNALSTFGGLTSMASELKGFFDSSGNIIGKSYNLAKNLPNYVKLITAGTKTVDSTTGHNEEQMDRIQKMRIWVPGINMNRINKKIFVNIPKPNYMNSPEPDKSLSGEWLVYGVRDKMINQYFVQELMLARPGSSEV